MNVMHTDTIYCELLVMYHSLIYSGSATEEKEGSEEPIIADLSNGNIEDQLQAASLAAKSKEGSSVVGRFEKWAKQRSKNAMREFRLKQVCM